jgi:signal transduction histidine kinase
MSIEKQTIKMVKDNVKHLEFKALLITLVAFLIYCLTRIHLPLNMQTLNDQSYLTLHASLGFIGIIIAFAIALQGFFSFPHTLSRYQLYLAAMFLAVGAFDLLHIVTMPGMPFIDYGQPTEISLWFWLSARMTESLSLLVIFCRVDGLINQSLRKKMFIGVIVFIVSVGIFSIWETVSANIIEALKPMQPEIFLDYLICVFYLLTIGFLLKRYYMRRLERQLIVILSLVFLFLGELEVATNLSTIDYDNLLGHGFKVLGYLYLFKGTYIDSIKVTFAWKRIALENEVTRKQFEHEIARLDRLNLVGEMAAGISHEIRNPITTVRGFLQLLTSKKDIQQYKSYITLMIDELDRANSIISEFLSFGKTKPKEVKIRNLNKIVWALAPLIEADALQYDKYLNLDLCELPDLLLDEEEIRQVILNLARNGLEAMEPGGTLTIKTSFMNNIVILAVQDQGKGIEPLILEKLGTPFFTTKEHGTGLGLATCFRIAAHHNGSLVISTSPAGSTFSLRIPK